VSCPRACRHAQFIRAKDQSALRLRIRDLVHVRPRFGYLRILGAPAPRRLADQSQ
jgi:putative transposase